MTAREWARQVAPKGAKRLTRTEYQNAVRDLLGVEIDATALLPQPSHGFDNVTVGTLSPTLVDRYVSAAQKIARLAVGTPRKTGAIMTSARLVLRHLVDLD